MFSASHSSLDNASRPPQGVFTGGGKGADDRAGVTRPESQPLRRTPGVEQAGRDLDAHDGEDVAGGAGPIDPRILQQGVDVDVEQPAGVLGPLDVATDPVQRLGDPTQHAWLL